MIQTKEDIEIEEKRFKAFEVCYSQTPNPEEYAEVEQLKRIVQKTLMTLTPRQEKIIRMRFGIGEKKEYSRNEVGEDFYISGGRIRCIESNAIKKLHLKLKWTLREIA